MRLPLLFSLLALSACQTESADGTTPTEEPEIAVTVTRDIQALPPSEITIGAAGASGTTGSGASSSATTTIVQSSNAAVQRVFTEFNARQTSGGIVLTLPENVLFDFDAAALRTDAEGALTKLQTVLGEYPNAPVEIVGHTDSKGEDAYNQTLSERRAQAVLAWMRDHGIAASRLTARGRGEQDPVAENETASGEDNPDGRQQNRRVEIVLRGATGSASPAGGATGGQPTSTIRTAPADSSR